MTGNVKLVPKNMSAKIIKYKAYVVKGEKEWLLGRWYGYALGIFHINPQGAARGKSIKKNTLVIKTCTG